FIKTTQSNIRDDQKLSILTSYNFTKQLGVGISAESRILSDNRTIGINEASISNVSLFTLYSPRNEIILAPFGGYTNNRQIGENDYGFLYGIEGSMNRLELSDFLLTSQLKLKNEDISPRKNLLRSEEHTSELQSRENLVCRLLLEKKKKST